MTELLERKYSGLYVKTSCATSGNLPTTISTSGGETETYNFPQSSWVDLFNTEWECLLNPVSSATAIYNWIHINTLPFRRIQVYYNGKLIEDISDLINIVNLCGVTFTTQKELNSRDNFYFSSTNTATTIPAGNGVFGVNQFLKNAKGLGSRDYPGINSSYTVNVPTVSATTVANYTFPSGVYSGVRNYHFLDRTDNTPCAKDEEVNYLLPCSISGASAPRIRYRFKLGEALKGTIFSSIRQDFKIVGDFTITFTYESPNRFIHLSTSSTSPITADATATSTSVATSCVIGSQRLLVPVQKDELVIQTNEMQPERTYVYDKTMVYPKSPGASGTQNMTIQVPQGSFQTIKMALFAPYHPSQTGENCLNHSNLADAKITSYYTQLGSKRLQNIDLDTSIFDDFSLHVDKLKGSCIMISSDTYQYNWVHVDNFGKPNAIDSINSNEIQGFDNTSENFNYSIYATTVSTAWVWYIVVIGQRIMKVSTKSGLIST